MKFLRSGLVAVLVASLSSAAFADDLRTSAARAAAKAVEEQAAMPAAGSGGGKTAMALGSALFIGGFAVGVYGFLDNQNGKPESLLTAISARWRSSMLSAIVTASTNETMSYGEI